MGRLLIGLKRHGIIGSAVIVKDILFNKYYRKRCIALKLQVWKDPTEEECIIIERALLENGIPAEELVLNKSEFALFENDFRFGNNFYGGKSSTLYNEKVLEHFIAYKFCIRQLHRSEDVYVDIAAANSPWAKLLREKGYNAVAIDLSKSKNYSALDYYRIMDATRTSFANNSISSASLQCAFEMFNRDDDIKLIRELGRILKQGGRAVICPLYLHTHYSGFSSPDYYFKDQYHDRDAKVYLAHNDMMGIPFARFYDVAKLNERVLHTISESGLTYRIIVLKNGKEIDPNIYCRFILSVEKNTAA